MSKQRELNQQVVSEIKDKLETSASVVLTDYRGLNVSQVTELRSQLRAAGVEYKVLKNTLTCLAAKDAGIEGLEEYLKGPTAIAFSKDPVAAAKILYKFSKTNKNLEIKSGVLDGRVVNLEQIKVLAELPSREELLSKVLGSMQAPLVNFASVLSAPLREAAQVLNAICEQKQKEA